MSQNNGIYFNIQSVRELGGIDFQEVSVWMCEESSIFEMVKKEALK